MTATALKTHALDLTQAAPRSPREMLGGYIIAARAVDKCRAVLNGSAGEYHSGCPLDNIWLDFAGISYDDFKAQVATGASDDELAAWIKDNAKQKSALEVIKWNNDWRYKRVSELSDKLQEFLEGYIPEVVPAGKIVYHFFDVYDYEEGRL